MDYKNILIIKKRDKIKSYIHKYVLNWNKKNIYGN